MKDQNPETNFEQLWQTFNNRYPFFELRGVDWKKEYSFYRKQVTEKTSEKELFKIFCEMLDPLNDGHVELFARIRGEKKIRRFCSEVRPYFWKQFNKRNISQLFDVAEKNLVENGFGKLKKTEAWIIRYSRSQSFGYIRILELEGVGKCKLTKALDRVAEDFRDLHGIIVDIRNNPGGDDKTVLEITNRFCDERRVAFRRKTKIGPGDDEFSKVKTWWAEPQRSKQFRAPVVLLTNDSVFSGGEVFALAMRELPHVKIIGDRTNGIFSYQLEKFLPNGWEFRLSYQIYYSADMVCYEAIGVPVDIVQLNKKSDIESGNDPLIISALEMLRSG